MEKHLIRLLRAEEIECRVSAVKETGLSLLLYKDARVDQRILDETFGLFGWQRSHQCIGGSLYCTVQVYDKTTGTWIAKQDVGTTGYTEKEKSQASDSFKRACFNWGIGRELYTAPFIWVAAANAAIKEDRNKSRLYCSDHFSVRSIGYNGNREINALTMANDTRQGQVVYELKADAPSTGTGKDATTSNRRNTKSQTAGTGLPDTKMESLEKELKRTGVGMEAVKERYQIEHPGQMTEELYQRIMSALAKTKSAA